MWYWLLCSRFARRWPKLFIFIYLSAIFIPDPKDGSLYAFGSAHDGLKVMVVYIFIV